MTSEECKTMEFIDGIIDNWKVMAYNEARLDCIDVINDVSSKYYAGELSAHEAIILMLDMVHDLRKDFN